MTAFTPTQRFLRSCRGETVDRPPVWLMRQAGRYLPEYRRVREQVSFLELCRDVDRAVEVSLQPIDAIGSEAVIFFSDIFTPIPGMGVDVDFRREPVTARALLDRLTDLTVGYLGAQIEAGAQAVQIFDTWAGMLSPADYREWVLPTHREIAAKLDRSAPLILYVNDGAHVLEETAQSGADVISLDWRVDLADAARRVGSRVSLQGNLDPCALAADAETIAWRVRELARDGAPARGHIINLGHGCLPDTPVEGVRAFTDAVRALGASFAQRGEAERRPSGEPR